jgi:hypothetical protein
MCHQIITGLRFWSFRATVALKISNTLSKPLLTMRTQESINIECILATYWNNFRKCTIPLDMTEKQGIITKRTIRNNLAVEMLRDTTSKPITRFDTPF